MNKLTLLEVKQSLRDERFRNLFPEHQDEINEFIQNPGCACNINLYRKLMKHKDRLQKYFPTKEIATEETNQWKVINCHIDELIKHLKKMSSGRKQLFISRWEDQITCIVNEVNDESPNSWKVINCKAEEAEGKMGGRKIRQVALGRWKDDVTIVINELGVPF